MTTRPSIEELERGSMDDEEAIRVLIKEKIRSHAMGTGFQSRLGLFQAGLLTNFLCDNLSNVRYGSLTNSHSSLN